MSDEDDRKPYIICVREGGTHLIWAFSYEISGGYLELLNEDGSMAFTTTQHNLLFCAPATRELAGAVGLKPPEDDDSPRA